MYALSPPRSRAAGGGGDGDAESGGDGRGKRVGGRTFVPGEGSGEEEGGVERVIEGYDADVAGGAVDVEASGLTPPRAVTGEGGGGGGEISGTDLALAVGELGGWEGFGGRESLLEAKAAHGGEEVERGQTDRRVAACVAASVVASCLLKELEAAQPQERDGGVLEWGISALNVQSERGRDLEAGKRARTDRRLTKGLEEGAGGRDRGGGRDGRRRSSSPRPSIRPLSQLKSHSPGMPIYVHTCCICICACLHAYFKCMSFRLCGTQTPVSLCRCHCVSVTVSMSDKSYTRACS